MITAIPPRGTRFLEVDKGISYAAPAMAHEDVSAAEEGWRRTPPLCKTLTMTSLRITTAVASVLRSFLEDPSRPRYGYDLMQDIGFPSGKLYPILARLHNAGILIKEKEQIDPVAAGRPARMMYRLSPEGEPVARRELATLTARLSLPESLAPRPEWVSRRHQGRELGWI
ncbi:PadR family transcriptional regulator [Saccharothrix sp. AJ9571]|nr:PadR family transcriptional regulator [Saccharothrix sp. AJ9571]